MKRIFCLFFLIFLCFQGFSQVTDKQRIKQQIQQGTISTIKQPEQEIKSAPKLNPENCRVNWSNSLHSVYNHIRGLNPFPAAWTEIQNGEEVISAKIYAIRKQVMDHQEALGSITTSKKEIKVAVSGGYILIDELKLSGKRKMDAISLLNGFSFLPEAKMR